MELLAERRKLSAAQHHERTRRAEVGNSVETGGQSQQAGEPKVVRWTVTRVPDAKNARALTRSRACGERDRVSLDSRRSGVESGDCGASLAAPQGLGALTVAPRCNGSQSSTGARSRVLTASTTCSVDAELEALQLQRAQCAVLLAMERPVY